MLQKPLTYCLFICLLLVACLPLQAQKNTSTAQPGSLYDKINAANRVMAQDPAQALNLVQEALAQSYREKNERGEAYCYNSLGAINYSLGRYQLAIDNYQKASQLFQKLKEADGLYNSEKYLAIAYEGKGELAEAARRYQLLLKKAQARKRTDDQIDIHRRLSRIYQLQNRDEAAQEQLSRITQLEQTRGNEQGLIDNLNTQGSYFVQQQDSNTAEKYYQDAVELAEKKGSPAQVAQSYENLSNLYRGKRDVSREIQTRQQAIKSNRKRKNKAGEVTNNLEIGKLYLDQGKANEAIPYLKATINQVEELGLIQERQRADSLQKPSTPARNLGTVRPVGSNDLLAARSGLPDSISTLPVTNPKRQEAQTQLKAEAYESLARAYEQQGALKEALASYKQAARLADSLAQLRDRALREALTVSRQLSERDEQIRALQQEQVLREAELKAQSRWLVGLTLGFVALIIAGLLVMRSYQAKRRANRLLALRSLRSQMNPHFIFNSLNSINSYISKNDERAANKYLANFSRLMRTVLEHSSLDFVPLSAEIQVLELYLKLEHARFSDQFDYTFEVDPNIDPQAMEVPPMLIQPYIENAIWHGLRYKKQGGFLRVALLQEGEHLVGIVEDDGIGRTRSAELKTHNQKKHKSTGLKNTAQRIELINSLYGKGVSVQITDLEPDAADCGTRVRLLIPFHTLN